MKKALSIGIIVLLAIGASFVVYASNVSNSKHNMLDHITDATQTTGEICVFCHTPHGAGTIAPLWNHALSSVSSYNVYGDPAGTIDGVFSQPSGVSLACLSCHDGTVAIDALVNSPSGYVNSVHLYEATSNINPSIGEGRITGTPNLGSDLSNDHPISITYVGTAGDPDLENNTLGEVISLKTGITLQLYGSSPYTVECASCHNVHDNTYVPFLRASNDGSALCLTCHNK